MKKDCAKCKEKKILIFFPKDKTRKDGFSYWCKECHSEYRQQNKNEINEYFKKHYQINKEYIKGQKKKYRKENKEKIKEREKKMETFESRKDC